MNAPLYRVFHKSTNAFIESCMLTNDNRVVVDSGNAISILEDVCLDIFTGLYTQTMKPMYQRDRITFSVLNEFGSHTIREGVIRYHAAAMRFFVDMVSTIESTNPEFLDMKYIDVIGYDHDHA